MRVSSRPNSPRGRGENDTIVTEAEPRFLLRHSRSRPQGLFGREGTRIQRLSYLENGYVRAGDRWPFLTSRHRNPMAANAVPPEIQLGCTCMIIVLL